MVLRDFQSGKTLQTWKHGGSVYSAAFSPDGQQVLTGSGDKTAVLRDVQSGILLRMWQIYGVASSGAIFTERSPDLRSALSQEISKSEAAYRALPQALTGRQSKLVRENLSVRECK